MAAAFAPPAAGWPPPAARGRSCSSRPSRSSRPTTPPPGRLRLAPPAAQRTAAFGPERIAPEWWLDDPAWRSGPRDYWRVETEEGTRLWIYEAQGGEAAPGWFAHGLFP